jgi:CubicO group peptidase (beta-lactamase class C family)
MRQYALLLLLITLAAPCLGQRSIEQHPRVREALALLEIWVDAQRAYQQIPGISMAVVHDQELLWSKGFGYANREQQISATPQTIYSICSISKLFTSVAVMQLRDAGKLRLDDRLAQHLEWFDIQDKFPDAPPVTIRGILTHSSGLPRESDYPYWSPPDFPFPTREQLIERVSEQEELYPAFEYFQYSNLGLSLAGEIVAAASGEAYGDYIQRTVLDPLDMNATYSDIPVDQHGSAMAQGYSARMRDGSRPPVKVFQARGIAPAAGYASTVEDLGKFASWQFRVLHHGADELLLRNTLREMYRVHWLDPDWETKWGLGFSTWRANDKTYVGHGGSCPGYRSQLAIEPTGKLATIFMANASGVNSGLFARRAQEIMGPAISEAVDTSETGEPPEAGLDIYTGSYSTAPWGGEIAVIVWKGNLALMSLPTDNPLQSLTELKKTGEHTFRRVRSDKSLGEEIRFDIGPDGKASRMWRHSNFDPRIKP